PIPGELLDSTHHHAVHVRVRRMPGQTAARDRFGGEAHARYRHNVDPVERWARAGARAGGYGLAEGRVDLDGEVAFVWSDGRPRLEGGPRLSVYPLPSQRLSLELAVLGLADLSGLTDPGHAALLESFAMVSLGRGLTLSFGYELQAAREGAPASSHTTVRHQGYLRFGARTR
ncbi:MAG: hypothetical protein KDA24_06215, partial [Deltaproteobacteria bacterium]|nr:hypothetical protein [Deltaproteobacteria bacterium]